MKRSSLITRKLRAFRLVASILGEGVLSLFHMVWFPFRRRAEQARVRAIIFGRVAQLFLVCALFVASGCSSFRTLPTLHRSLQELQWSVHALADMSDAKQSLNDDLATLSDPDAGAFRETIELWGW